MTSGWDKADQWLRAEAGRDGATMGPRTYRLVPCLIGFVLTLIAIALILIFWG